MITKTSPFINQFVEVFPATINHASLGTKTANKESPDDYVSLCLAKTLTEAKEQPDAPMFGSVSAATQSMTFTAKETPDSDMF
jgi:hypothetical protein